MQTVRTLIRYIPIALILSIIWFVMQTLLGELIVDILSRFGVTAKGFAVLMLSHPLETAIGFFLLVLAASLLRDLLSPTPNPEKLLPVESEKKVVENPIRVEIRNPAKRVRHEKRYISIEIHNDSPGKEIEACKVQLISVVNANNIEPIKHIQQYLLWNARHHAETQDGISPLNIPANDYGLCDVVKEEGPTSVRYLTRIWEKTPLWVDTGNYFLYFTVSGKYDGFSIFKKYSCTMICDVHYEVELKDMKETGYVK